jgi:hypothetical protein
MGPGQDYRQAALAVMDIRINAYGQLPAWPKEVIQRVPIVETPRRYIELRMIQIQVCIQCDQRRKPLTVTLHSMAPSVGEKTVFPTSP